jgi:DNA-binding transcriptional LysR family regulator
VVAKDCASIGDTLKLTQYLAQQHVTFENNGRPQFETWFTDTHGKLPHQGVVVNNFSLLPQLVVGTARVATLQLRMALAAARIWPIRLVRLEFEAPLLVETLQWHRYRDQDPGSQWIRDQIMTHAQAMPALSSLSGLAGLAVSSD